MQYFADNNNSTKQHYCPNCWYLYNDKQEGLTHCPQEFCGVKLPTGASNQSYFLRVDIASELSSRIVGEYISNTGLQFRTYGTNSTP